jgi:hypothetical protein
MQMSRFLNKLSSSQQVSPKENLPQQICDLCIVQLNVSYNFKRLALKNDFYIRQYMIENGMNLTKEDEDHSVSTQLEIHQIHNVFRTSNYRPQAPPAISSVTELRRNSTTSSVSGVSMLANGCDSNGVATNGSTNGSNFAHPTRPFVRPIQIKTEPVDPDYEDTTTNGTNVNETQSSPSSSSNDSVSVLTVTSSENVSRPKTPPMIVINGHISNEEKTPKTAMKKAGTTPSSPKRVRIVEKKKEPERPRDAVRNLRTIVKAKDQTQSKRKLREAARKMLETQQKTQKEAKLKKQKKAKQATASKKNASNSSVSVRRVGRPPKQNQYQQPKKSLRGRGQKRT